MENKIVCPQCQSKNKELYMTHGQIVGHRWICKDCGKVYDDENTKKSQKKTFKILGTILLVVVIILIILIIISNL